MHLLFFITSSLMFTNILTFKHDRVDTGFSYLFCQKIIYHQRLSQCKWGHPDLELRRESCMMIKVRFMVRMRWTIHSSNSPGMFGMFPLGPPDSRPSALHLHLSPAGCRKVWRGQYCKLELLQHNLEFMVRCETNFYNKMRGASASIITFHLEFPQLSPVSSGTVWYWLIIKLFKLSTEGWRYWCDTWYRSNPNH